MLMSTLISVHTRVQPLTHERAPHFPYKQKYRLFLVASGVAKVEISTDGNSRRSRKIGIFVSPLSTLVSLPMCVKKSLLLNTSHHAGPQEMTIVVIDAF